MRPKMDHKRCLIPETLSSRYVSGAVPLFNPLFCVISPNLSTAIFSETTIFIAFLATFLPLLGLSVANFGANLVHRRVPLAKGKRILPIIERKQKRVPLFNALFLSTPLPQVKTSRTSGPKLVLHKNRRHRSLTKNNRRTKNNKKQQKNKKIQVMKRKMTNQECFWKKGFGGKKEQNISRIAGNPFSVSQIITPFEKPQNCRENGVSCHNLKAKQQTQTKKENKPKKQKIKNTTTIKTATTEKPEGPKCKEIRFGKGMWLKCV